MRSKFVPLLVFCLASAGLGQWLERTIWPRIVGEANLAIYNPSCNEVLVGSQYGMPAIARIDPAANRLVGLVNLPRQVADMVYEPSTGKVFCSHAFDSSVTILDGTTYAVLARVRVGGGPHRLRAAGGRVYSGNWYSNDLSVIDAAAESVVATVPTGMFPFDLCYNPTSNKLYSANRDAASVTVINVANNQVLATVAAGSNPASLCFNSAKNRVYCANWDTDSVTVIDGVSNSVVARVKVARYPERVCYNPADNKVYVSHRVSDTIAVIDGETNSVRRLLPAGEWGQVIVHSPVSDRTYCLNFATDDITVIDGPRDSVASTVVVQPHPSAACFDSAGARLFAACQTGVSVVACGPDTVVGRVPFDARPPAALGWDPRNGKVYVAGGGNSLVVIDARACALVSIVPVRPRTEAVCCDTVLNRVFCADSAGITVVDAGPDTVYAGVALRGAPAALAWSEPAGKVYCGQAYGGVDTVFAVDCSTLAVTSRIPVGRPPHCLLSVPSSWRLYCANYQSDSVTIIDTHTDSVVATVAVGDGPRSLCLGPDRAKVYCANDNGSAVSVLDAVGDSVIRTVDVAYRPVGLCASVASNKVYCASWMGQKVSVLDAETDSVIAEVSSGNGPYRLCYDARNDLVYCANVGLTMADSFVRAIDCRTDSVVAQIHVGADSRDLIWTPESCRAFLTSGDNIWVLRCNPTGVEDRSAPRADGSDQAATVARGVLFLREASSPKLQAASWLLDISGRRVLDLHPGANDVRALAPGVYFVREAQAQAQAQAVRKVVITR